MSDTVKNNHLSTTVQPIHLQIGSITRGQPGFRLRNPPRKVNAPAKGRFHKTRNQITSYRLALSP